MPPQVASLVFWALILWLFCQDLRGAAKTSNALWIPALYLFVVASRPVSLWLNVSTWAGVQQSADGSPIDAAFYALLQILSLMVLVQRQTMVGRLLRPAWPVLLYFGYCLFSLTWSEFPLIALKRWVKLLGDLMMVLVVLTDPQPLAAIKRFFLWPGFLLLPLSILFVKYYPEMGRGYDGWTGAQYFHGVSYNKNGLGVICLYWGIGAAWLFVTVLYEKVRNRRELMIAGLCLAMALWLLGKSSSATSLSCFLMGVILILSSRFKLVYKNPIFLHAAAIGMVLVPFSVLFLGSMSGALNVLQRDSTLTGRTELWEAIFRIPINPVVGAGYESFWLGWRIKTLWSQFWWSPTQAHNGYIETYINLGWIGIVALTGILVAGYFRAISSIKNRDPWGGLVLACIVVSVPYNFTEATFRMQNLPWLFLLLAVIGIPFFPKKDAQTPAGRNGEIPSPTMTAELLPLTSTTKKPWFARQRHSAAGVFPVGSSHERSAALDKNERDYSLARGWKED